MANSVECKVDKVSSDRITALRFPLIVLVVFIHAFSSAIYTGDQALLHTTGHGVDYYIRYAGSTIIARIAVPLYFVFAGYLLQLGVQLSWRAYREKIKSRVGTLLVPHLLWTTLTVVLYLALEFLPGSAGLFSGSNRRVSDYSLFDFFNAVLGITQAPNAYQFWFTRNLMVLVLLWPVLWWALKLSRMFLILPIAIIWFSGLFPAQEYILSSTLFFLCGVALAMGGMSLFATDRFGPWIVAAYAVAIAADLLSLNTPWYRPLHNATILLGCLSALFLTRFSVMSPGVSRILTTLAPASFFVFAAHEPLLTLVRRVVYRVVRPDDSPTLIAIYLAVPTLLIATLLACYFAMMRFAPTLLSFATGARTKRSPRSLLPAE